MATLRVSRGSAARPVLPPADRHVLPRITRDADNKAAAEQDTFKAHGILCAIKKRTPGVSERLLKIIWLLRQPGVCEEFCQLTELDAKGDLSYDTFRGADSLEASASVFLPDGFLNFDAFSGGGFYATALVAECGGDDGVTEVALRAVEEKSKAKAKETQATDAILIEAVRKGVKDLKDEDKPFASFPYAGIVGGKGRHHATRYEEKVNSDQLFGRFGRELVRAAAGGDVESTSEDEIFAAAERKMVVHNRVFMSEPLFIAVAMLGGEAYRRDEKGITAIEQDVEGMAGALTGGMIETGGLNVAFLGCEAAQVPGRTDPKPDAHFAFCFMRDIAFAEAESDDAAAFKKAYESVKTSPARDVFEDDQRMMLRLAGTPVLLEEEGLDALAKADAEALAGRELPTYDTIDAGTFARALAAEMGRKGGSTTAKLVRDYFDPEVEQSAEDKRTAENIIFGGTPAGAMTGDAKRAHVDKSEAGGGTPAGKMTDAAKRVHVTKSEAAGGTPAGKLTDAAKRAHADKSVAGGATPAGAKISDKDHLRQIIGKYIKKQEDGSPIAVSRLTVCTDSENTYTFYASRAASLEDYKAVCFELTDEERHRKLYDIVCTSGAKKTSLVLPLSNESRCEGPAIGGKWESRCDAWRGWSRDAYSNLTKEGVTWRVEDVPITEDTVRAHELEKAEKKSTHYAKRKKKRKRVAPSAPGPGVET